MDAKEVTNEIYKVNKMLRELHLKINEDGFDKSTLHLEDLDVICISIEHMHSVSSNIYDAMKVKYNEKLVEKVRNM